MISTLKEIHHELVESYCLNKNYIDCYHCSLYKGTESCLVSKLLGVIEGLEIVKRKLVF